MELLFESRHDVLDAANGKLRAVQGKAEILPEPVLECDTFVDGTGASIYGSVLHDGGMYRMWYQAWPKDWDGRDVACVGYAESDDGFNWRKPKLGIVKHGPDAQNNLCNLGFHSPSVFIDPTAEPAKRYRATGCVGPNSVGCIDGVTQGGYHTACSADGLHWTLDSRTPCWPASDVITSIWHAGRGESLVAFKRGPRFGGIHRRSIWTDRYRNDGMHEGVPALIPDEYDDVVATMHGCNSADYYGMGMQAAGLGTAGFVWHFRHQLPKTPGSGAGVFGVLDVGLAFQHRAGHPWRHMYGRKDFLTHDSYPWMRGGLCTASAPIECGDEHRMYVTGIAQSHGWYIDEKWQLIEPLKTQLISTGLARIGVAKWPAWRLFGLDGDADGHFMLHLGKIDRPCRLQLNYECRSGGSVRAMIEGDAARTNDTCTPLTDNEIRGAVHWNNGDVIQPCEDLRILVTLDRATAWAWDLVDA